MVNPKLGNVVYAIERKETQDILRRDLSLAVDRWLKHRNLTMLFSMGEICTDKNGKRDYGAFIKLLREIE